MKIEGSEYGERIGKVRKEKRIFFIRVGKKAAGGGTIGELSGSIPKPRTMTEKGLSPMREERECVRDK